MATDNNELKLPTDVRGMVEASNRFHTPEATAYWKAFKPKPDDIFVTTFAKSGTTWMQQIMHCLRTSGDMSYEEITVVVPWIEVAFDMGIDLEDPQTKPRLFKSHLAADDIPAGAKYIVIFRNPADVLLSFYHFMEGWFFEPGTVSLTEFSDAIFFNARGSHNYWHHVSTWWPRHEDETVVLLCYEDMRQDIRPVISRVADFANIPLTEELLELTVHNSSHDFMRRHGEKFDDHVLQQALNGICGLPISGQVSKVSRQDSGAESAIITDEISARLRENWQSQVTKPFGFRDYEEFRQAVANS